MSMNNSSTEVDELQLENMKKSRFDAGDRFKKYAEVYWSSLPDQNQGIYTKPIMWDTLPLKDELPVWADGRAMLPLRVQSSTATLYDDSTRLAVKNSVLDFIYSLSARPTGHGPQFMNDNEGALPIINAIRRLTTSDIDWINCTGQQHHFTGLDRKLGPVMGGGKAVLSPAQSQLSIGVPDNDIFSNARLADRVTIFTTQSDHETDDQYFDMIVSVPLKYLHPFFAQLDFPLPNYPMKIEMGVSSATNGCSGFMPICTPQRPVVAVADAAGVITTGLAVPAAPLPKISINKEVSIRGFKPGGCRLYVKCVKLTKSDADWLDAALEKDAYKKTITYPVSEIYSFQNKPTSAAGKAITEVFGENTLRPVRVWALFPPFGALEDPTSVFPSTVGPAYVQDCNLKINTKWLRDQNYENQEELYQDLAQYQLGSAHQSIQGAQISYNDFINGARYYLFDLERHPTVLNNLPVTFTFSGKLYDSNNSAIDAIFIVERLRTIFISVSKNKSTTTEEDGVPSK